MSLITLPDGHKWVYSESLDRGHFNDDPAVYARHSQTYDVLRADAPSARESAALISDVMEGYEHHGQARAERGDLDQEQLQRRQRRRLHRIRPRIPGIVPVRDSKNRAEQGPVDLLNAFRVGRRRGAPGRGP
jgi:hypothetical protein